VGMLGTRCNGKKAGRFPLYFLSAKWGEIRDCTLDDAWFKAVAARPMPVGSTRVTA
jgi:hypothetical protein